MFPSPPRKVSFSNPNCWAKSKNRKKTFSPVWSTLHFYKVCQAHVNEALLLFCGKTRTPARWILKKRRKFFGPYQSQKVCWRLQTPTTQVADISASKSKFYFWIASSSLFIVFCTTEFEHAAVTGKKDLLPSAPGQRVADTKKTRKWPGRS